MLHRMRTSIESMAVGVLKKFPSWDRSYQDRGGFDTMRTGGNISVLVRPCPVLKGQTSRPCSICKALPGTDLSPWTNMGPRKSLSPLLHSLRRLQRSKDETISRSSDGDLSVRPRPRAEPFTTTILFIPQSHPVRGVSGEFGVRKRDTCLSGPKLIRKFFLYDSERVPHFETDNKVRRFFSPQANSLYFWL